MAVTSFSRRAAVIGAEERGVALIGVLLLLIMISALVAALSVSSETETLIVRNELAAGQAQAAAEAGLNHAAQVVTDYIWDWKANGFASVELAVDAVLANADAGNVDGLTTCGDGLDACAVEHTMSAGLNAKYYIEIVDDATGSPPAMNGGATEDANPVDDQNRAIVIRAKGTAHDGTKVVLEALLAPFELGAIVSNGDLTINGNITVDGEAGSVHSNGDLTTNGGGNSASISGDVTASGDYNGSLAGAMGGQPVHKVPEVDPSDYREYADYLLTSAGLFKCDNSAGCTGGYAYGATIRDCTAPPANFCKTTYGIEWTNASSTWSFVNSHVSGTYYVETDADISGPGTMASPVALTVIAEGSIDVGGNTFLTPHTTELLFVAGVDLSLNGGGASGDIDTQGQVLVHEQVAIGGSPFIAGQLIIENATNTAGSPVTDNTIGGSVHITYDGGLGSATYSIVGWRDVRQ
jgi:Tfp pilus assembly protein PilX